MKLLPNADKIVTRQVDLRLRRLMGQHRLDDMLNPNVWQRDEQQVLAVLSTKLSSSGIRLIGFDIERVVPPPEIARAQNQAIAIRQYDAAIRDSAPETRRLLTYDPLFQELFVLQATRPGMWPGPSQAQSNRRLRGS